MILAPGALALAAGTGIKIQSVFVESTNCWEEKHMLIVSLPAGLGAGLPGPVDPHTRRRHEVA